MKQEKFKLLAASALLLAVGLIATGCKNDFDGTTVNYEEKKLEMTDNLGPATSAWTGYIDVNNTWIDQAGAQSNIEVRIKSPVRLDPSTVEGAITFYKLKNNTENADWYPMHDGECTKTLVNSSETRCEMDYANNATKQDGVQTVFKYDVDTSAVTTKQIALIVDATKLKDIEGNFVLNLDNNYKAGQESDSYIAYINIGRDKDGNQTTNLSYKIDYAENFRKDFLPVKTEAMTITANGTTGKWDITIPAVAVSAPGATAAYDETFVGKMNEAFVLYTKALEAAEYKQVALEWGYASAEYKATTEELSYGTDFTVLMIKKDYTAPAWFSQVYGHPGFVDAKILNSTTDLLGGTRKTSTYIKDQPDFIVDDFTDPADSGNSWAAAAYDEADIIANQNALLHVTLPDHTYKYVSGHYGPSNYLSGYYNHYFRWVITPETNVVLDKYEDFILTDKNYKKLEAKISIVKNSDDSLSTIYIELKNPIRSSSSSSYDTPKLYVGSGTTLKENSAYPNQLKFGTSFKDPLMGDASGYIPLSKD